MRVASAAPPMAYNAQCQPNYFPKSSCFVDLCGLGGRAVLGRIRWCWGHSQREARRRRMTYVRGGNLRANCQYFIGRHSAVPTYLRGHKRGDHGCSICGMMW